MGLSDEQIDNGEWSINYRNVMADNKRLTVTRMLAANLISEPYMTIKDFLLSLSDTDLEALLDIYDAGVFQDDTPHDDRASDIVLISSMLAQAEGLEQGSIEESTRRISALSMFLVVESLARKGLVKVHRDNMSFGEDMGDRVVVERIE